MQNALKPDESDRQNGRLLTAGITVFLTRIILLILGATTRHTARHNNDFEVAFNDQEVGCSMLEGISA